MYGKLKKASNAVLGIPALMFLFTARSAMAEYPLNLTQGVTPISREVYDLHMIILYIVTVIGIGVFGVMFWSIFHHRKSKGAVAQQFHHNTFVEVLWTIIPVLILVAMAVPATKTLIKMEETGEAEMTIKVTGYQWKWKYDYIEEGISFFSTITQDSYNASQRGEGDPHQIENYLLDVDNPVVLPVNKKIRILTTAADVIHGWWVPALGWKRDAVPGFINDNWTIIEVPGTYRGQCAELCGKDHAYMPVVVKAVEESEYRTWVAEMKATEAAKQEETGKTYTMDEQLERGETVYGTQCAVCHQPQGQGIPGVFAALDGSAIVNGPAAEHISIVLNGQKLMPAFREQLSDAEIAAVLTYERNTWSNSAGDVVQPADVKAAR